MGRKRRGAGEGSVYRSPDGRWRGAVDLGWEGGKRSRKYVSAPTQAGAIAKLREAQRAAAEGMVTDRQTVAQLARWWLDTVVPAQVNSPNSLAHYRQIVECHLIPELGAIPVAKLSSEQVDAWLASRAHLAQTYVARMRSTLVQILRVPVRRGRLARNVAEHAAIPRAKRAGPRRSFSPAEARSLITAARGERLEALVVVGLVAGLRPGEVAGLLWADIDLDGDPPTLRVSGMVKRRPGDGSVWRDSEPKRSRAGRRTVALPAVAVEALRGHQQRQDAERVAAGELWSDQGLVFASQVGTPVDPSRLRTVFGRVARRAGIDHAVPYLMRHSAASLLLDAGASIEEVADVLGDDPATIYRHYRHRVRAVASATSRMDAVLASSPAPDS